MEPADLSKIIADTCSTELQEKFIKGQHEHGGDFATKPTVKNIREEILDLVNYSHVLILHRSQVLMALEKFSVDCENMSSVDVKARIAQIRKMVHEM